MGANKKTFGTSTEFSAVRAGLRSMVRANLNHVYTLPVGLVYDELLKLEEAPAIKPKVKPSAFSHLPYSFEVFQHNSSCVTICNNLFADCMVPVSLETPLSARNSFEPFLSTSSAFALEPCSQSLEFKPVSLDFSAAKELFIACYSNMVYSGINTNLKRVGNLADVSGKSDVKEHSALFINGKQSSLIAPIKIFPIVFRNFNGNINSAIDSCNSNFVRAKGKCSLVKGKRHNRFESGFRTFSGFDRLQSLRSNTVSVYDKLRRQVKLLPCAIIAKMMKIISVVNSSLISFICNIRNSLGVLLHSAKKQFVLRDFQLDCCNRFHKLNIGELAYKVYAYETSGFYKQEGGNGLPPITKVMGIRPTIL